MKVRSGFVSNSSTSSFLIYGVFLEDSQIEEMLGEDVDVYDELDSMTSKAGLEVHHPDGFDGYYIGESWSAVGDDETGKQFKERVKKTIIEMFGKKGEGLDLACQTLSEAYYS